MNSRMNSGLFKSVEIEINHGCNLSCSYCPNSKFKRIENGEMEIELFSLIISQLKDLDFDGRISFSFYNEPTINSKFKIFTEIVNRELPKASLVVYSNGTQLTIEKIRDYFSSGVAKFIITKHMDFETSERFIFDETYKQLSDEEKKRVEYKSFTQLKLTNRGGSLPEVGLQEKLNLIPCFIPQNILTISVKGNVIPCFEDFFQVHQMKNVKEMHLRDIWNLDSYIDFRKKLQLGLRHQFDVCKNCNRTEVLF